MGIACQSTGKARYVEGLAILSAALRANETTPIIRQAKPFVRLHTERTDQGRRPGRFEPTQRSFAGFVAHFSSRQYLSPTRETVRGATVPLALIPRLGVGLYLGQYFFREFDIHFPRPILAMSPLSARAGHENVVAERASMSPLLTRAGHENVVAERA
jgi:hypothetical protein